MLKPDETIIVFIIVIVIVIVFHMHIQSTWYGFLMDFSKDHS